MKDAFQTYPDQIEFRKVLRDQWRKDIATLIHQERWPPPWTNDDFALQQDEARLLTAIADNAGLAWKDDRPDLCQVVANMIGMNAIGNAKATVRRCIDMDYVRPRHDREAHVIMLDLTDLGAAVLELWENDQSLNAER